MKHITYSVGIILAISLLLNNCTKEEKIDLSPIEVYLSNVLTIESNVENNGPAPILPFVADAAVNSEGHIFISTGQDSKFHIYEQDGEWLQSFGQSGAGPGEFRQISAIYIDNRNRLIVADRGNGRISIFDSQGSLIATSSSAGINTIRSIREMPDGRFIVTGQKDDYLVHIFDSEFDSIQSSFTTIGEFANIERESERQWIKGQAGQAHPWRDGQIVFVPANYQGRVYLYEEKNINEWNLIDELEGYNLYEPALTFHSDQPSSGTPVHGILGSPDGMMFISYRTLSYGFYQNQEGSLYHISYLTTEEGMNLVIEHFDTSSNKLIEYGIVDDLNIEHSLRKQPLWMDESLNLYLSDNSELPKLQIMKLELQ